MKPGVATVTPRIAATRTMKPSERIKARISDLEHSARGIAELVDDVLIELEAERNRCAELELQLEESRSRLRELGDVDE